MAFRKNMSLSLTLYYGSLTICMLVALYLRNELTDNFRWLFWLICFTWAAESLGLYLMLNLRNNHFVFHVLQPVEYTLLSLFFQQSFTKPSVKRLVSASIIGFVAFCLIDTLLLESLSAPNSYSFAVEAVLLIGLSAYYLYQLLQSESYVPLRSIPEFWVSAGVLFFYAGAFFLMGLLNYLTKTDYQLARRLFFINHLLNIILYGLYAVGFVWKAHQVKLARL